MIIICWNNKILLLITLLFLNEINDIRMHHIIYWAYIWKRCALTTSDLISSDHIQVCMTWLIRHRDFAE